MPVEAPQGFGNVTWPALTEDELNYMWIHIDDVEPRINYRQKEMAFWREYMSYIVDVEILNKGNLAQVKMGIHLLLMSSVVFSAPVNSPKSKAGLDSQKLLEAMEKMSFGAFDFDEY